MNKENIKEEIIEDNMIIIEIMIIETTMNIDLNIVIMIMIDKKK